MDRVNNSVGFFQHIAHLSVRAAVQRSLDGASFVCCTIAINGAADRSPGSLSFQGFLRRCLHNLFQYLVHQE